MANTGNLATDLSGVLTAIDTVDTVVDAIRAVDITGLAAGIVGTRAVVDAIRAVDVPALTTVIEEQGLTDKEKALINCHGQPALNQYFLDVAHNAAPNVDFWNIQEGDVNCHVYIVNDAAVDDLFAYLQVKTSGGVADASAYTKDLIYWALKDNINTIKLKSYVYISAVDAKGFCYGFVKNSYDMGTYSIMNGNNNTAGLFSLVADADVYFKSSTDADNEQTDITAHVPLAEWFLLEIDITVAEVICKINGTIRATHTTRIPIPGVPLQFVISDRSAAAMEVDSQFVQVWTENVI